jgi:hypothetical protein
MNKKVLTTVFLTIIPLWFFSQNVSKDMKISICEGYINPEKALSLIEKSYNITFSYNPSQFTFKKEIYLCRKDVSINTVLNDIFGRETDLIIEKRHIIVKPAKQVETIIKYKTVKISGTVENSINGIPVDSAIVSVNGSQVFCSNNGYFSLKTSTNSDSLVIFTEKENYIGYISVVESKDQALRIFLQPSGSFDYTYMPSTLDEKNPEIENYWLADIIIPEEQANITRNRRNLTDKEYQFSVIPGIGKYNNQSGLCRFTKSFNLLAGYVGEVNGLEVGLGVNIVRYDMTGFQASGIANIVGGEVSGWQISTGANITAGNFRGAQTSYIVNSTWGNFYGIQLTAGANIVRAKVRGLQVAPVNIVVDTLLGFQVGGVNIAGRTTVGPQLSAVMNYSPENKKLQFSTLLNITETNNSPQIGLINITGNQNNLQLGALNFADTVNGFTIGLLSFVKDGFTHLDYSLNSDLMSNLKFQTGIPHFYNIIKAGLRTDKESDFEIGYGFGSYFRLWRWIGLNYELTASQLFENNSFMLNPNIHSQLNLCLNFSIAKHFTVYFGGQLNTINTTNFSTDNINYFSSLPPAEPLIEKQYKNQKFYMWPGFVMGFRL